MMEVSTQIEVNKSIPFLTQGAVDWERDPLSFALIEQGKIKRSELQQLLEVSSSRSDALGVALVRYGILSEIDLATILSEITALPVLEASAYSVIESAPEQLPLRFLKSTQVIPLDWDDETMILAMAEPRDLDTIHSISAIVNLKIEPRIGLCSHIQNCIDRLIGLDQQPVEEISIDTDEDLFPSEETYDDVSHLRELASEAPTIQTVNRILQEAISLQASDIHLEPGSEGVRVRYRVDGALRFGETLPLKTSAAINSRIKIMAKLDIAEHRLPQDGRIQIKIAGRDINIRVSTVPILYGESVVIRILDKSRVVYDYDFLGLDEQTLTAFKQILTSPTGIFLATGPTGSGKTTTLYTGLRARSTRWKRKSLPSKIRSSTSSTASTRSRCTARSG